MAAVSSGDQAGMELAHVQHDDDENESYIEKTDPKSGRKYYYNTRTQKSSWEKPVRNTLYSAEAAAATPPSPARSSQAPKSSSPLGRSKGSTTAVPALVTTNDEGFLVHKADVAALKRAKARHKLAEADRLSVEEFAEIFLLPDEKPLMPHEGGLGQNLFLTTKVWVERRMPAIPQDMTRSSSGGDRPFHGGLRSLENFSLTEGRNFWSGAVHSCCYKFWKSLRDACTVWVLACIEFWCCVWCCAMKKKTKATKDDSYEYDDPDPKTGFKKSFSDGKESFSAKGLYLFFTNQRLIFLDCSFVEMQTTRELCNKGKKTTVVAQDFRQQLMDYFRVAKPKRVDYVMKEQLRYGNAEIQNLAAIKEVPRTKLDDSNIELDEKILTGEVHASTTRGEVMLCDFKYFHAIPLKSDEITDIGLSFSVIDNAVADSTEENYVGAKICCGSCFGLCSLCCDPSDGARLSMIVEANANACTRSVMFDHKEYGRVEFQVVEAHDSRSVAHLVSKLQQSIKPHRPVWEINEAEERKLQAIVEDFERKFAGDDNTVKQLLDGLKSKKGGENATIAKVGFVYEQMKKKAATLEKKVEGNEERIKKLEEGLFKVK